MRFNVVRKSVPCYLDQLKGFSADNRYCRSLLLIQRLLQKVEGRRTDGPHNSLDGGIGDEQGTRQKSPVVNTCSCISGDQHNHPQHVNAAKGSGQMQSLAGPNRRASATNPGSKSDGKKKTLPHQDQSKAQLANHQAAREVPDIAEQSGNTGAQGRKRKGRDSDQVLPESLREEDNSGAANDHYEVIEIPTDDLDSSSALSELSDRDFSNVIESEPPTKKARHASGISMPPSPSTQLLEEIQKGIARRLFPLSFCSTN
jgi:hypothetical protein